MSEQPNTRNFSDPRSTNTNTILLFLFPFSLPSTPLPFPLSVWITTLFGRDLCLLLARRGTPSQSPSSPAARPGLSQLREMATVAAPTPKLDRYIVIHVATTCDEHGVYVTKDSAEVIELGWILLDTKTCEEVRAACVWQCCRLLCNPADRVLRNSCTGRVCSSNPSTPPSLRSAVSSRRSTKLAPPV